MHKVIVINLSGNAYQIDEDGYHALRAYLDRAAANLAGNPDRAEILHWLGGFKRPPGITYIVHGEPEAAAALREAVVGTLGWRAEVARDGQRVTV